MKLSGRRDQEAAASLWSVTIHPNDEVVRADLIQVFLQHNNVIAME